MKHVILSFLFLILLFPSEARVHKDTIPVWGICLRIPPAESADIFINFVKEELVPAGINTIVLRIEYNFPYKKYPKLSLGNEWDMKSMKRLVTLCKANNINLIPSINLLGHQSWQSTAGRLLAVFPEFDETPGITLPVNYKWPNPEGLYCKSYCPNHPDVHKVVFACVDELLEAFEAKDFHAGLDEVFYIAHPDCPRCGGQNPANVFAEEVNRINHYLKSKGVKMWMWGDRLIDGISSGLGEWCASVNGTWPAVDKIDKDIMICDWQYVKAHPTPPYFAMKGFEVITCGHQRPEVTREQIKNLKSNRQNVPASVKSRFNGFMLTVWSSFDTFYNDYRTVTDTLELKASNSFRVMKLN